MLATSEGVGAQRPCDSFVEISPLTEPERSELILRSIEIRDGA